MKVNKVFKSVIIFSVFILAIQKNCFSQDFVDFNYQINDSCGYRLELIQNGDKIRTILGGSCSNISGSEYLEITKKLIDSNSLAKMNIQVIYINYRIYMFKNSEAHEVFKKEIETLLELLFKCDFELDYQFAGTDDCLLTFKLSAK